MKKFFAVGLGIAAVAGVCYAIKKAMENYSYDECYGCEGCEGCDGPAEFADKGSESDSGDDTEFTDESEDGLRGVEGLGGDVVLNGAHNTIPSDDDIEKYAKPTKELKDSKLYNELLGEEEVNKILDETFENEQTSVKLDKETTSVKLDKETTSDAKDTTTDVKENSAKVENPNVSDIKESIESIGGNLSKLFNGVKGLTSEKVEEISKRDDVIKAKEAMYSAMDKLNKIVDEASPKAEKAINDAMATATVMVGDAVKAGENFVAEHPEITDLMNKSVDTVKNTLDATFGTGFDNPDVTANTPEDGSELGDMGEQSDDVPDISGVQSTDGKSFETDLTEDEAVDKDTELEEEAMDDINDTDVPPDDGEDINTDLT